MNHGPVRGDLALHRDAFPEHAPEHLDHPPDDFPGIDVLSFLGLAAANGEKFAGQVSGALGGGRDFANTLARDGIHIRTELKSEA